MLSIHTTCSPKARIERNDAGIVDVKDAAAAAIKKRDVAVTSCLSLDHLVFIARLYNASHADKIPIMKTRVAMARAIDATMRGTCSPMDEVCWIKQPFVSKARRDDERELQSYFKPPKPASWSAEKNKWLNTVDISKVMKQYDEAPGSDFRFVGVFPIDFATVMPDGQCVSPEICTLDVDAEMSRGGKRKFGFVFNTDRHDGRGLHWIALYVCLDPNDRNFGVYFYDSIARPAPSQIVQFMDRMKEEIARVLRVRTKRVVTVPCKSNAVRRQYKNTECGIFSMVFLILMQVKRFSAVCKWMGTDHQIEKFRDVLNGMGINATQPSATLHVGGNVRMDRDAHVLGRVIVGGGGLHLTLAPEETEDGHATDRDAVATSAVADAVATSAAENNNVASQVACAVNEALQDRLHQIITRIDDLSAYISRLEAMQTLEPTRTPPPTPREEDMRSVVEHDVEVRLFQSLSDKLEKMASRFVTLDEADARYAMASALIAFPTAAQTQATYVRKNVLSNYATHEDVQTYLSSLTSKHVNYNPNKSS